MNRGLAAMLVAAALAAGCGGDEPEGGVAGAEKVETVPDSPRRADAFATADELAWMRRFAAWAVRFSRHGGTVAEYENGPGFAKAAAGDDAELDRYKRLLEPFRACEDAFADQVGPAPTDRLREAERNVVEACRLYRGGIDLLLESMEENDPGLADRARYQLQDGNAKINVAAGLLPPGEKQKLPVARGATGKSRIDPRYGKIASAVANKPVEARCWSPRDWARLLVEEKALTRGHVNEEMIAFASAGGERINLGPYVCRNLDALVYDGRRPRDSVDRLSAAQALGALVHESLHASGVADEPTTECHAMQKLPQAAEAAGIPRDYARVLVATAWKSYPTLPIDYQSPECRPGGELDLTPGDGRFP